MTPSDAEAFLFDLPRFADKGGAAYAPGLDRVRALLRAMGDPHLALPVVHVAGTNGKGSTASFVAAIGTASGRRVGLHTSPHLLSLRERMRVDGVPAPPEWLAGAVGEHEAAMREIGPSFFEATVALSLLYFHEQNVDLAVVEVGLGGRLDATNVVEPLVCLVTHIGLDHTDLLGDTLAAIAREKAGIAKPSVPFLHAVLDEEARAALAGEAHQRGATVEAVRETIRVERREGALTLTTEAGAYGPILPGLTGAHQSWNAALAVRAAEVAMPGVDRPSVERGLREVVARAGLRGRGERWKGDPRIVLDVAHNPDGWRAALDEAPGRLVVLVGAMGDKDIAGLVPLLSARDARVWAVGLPGDRALSADALAAAVGGETMPSVQEALERFQREAGPRDHLLVTGSHVTVSEALAALESE